MFETVLVAARGPLARRVVRTCQRLGVRAVTVHSEADAASRHVTEADDSVLLGPAPPEQSYLDRRRVLEAARQCGASAVHPGGGALASDAALARAVLDAGLTWVGAPPEVLDRTADRGEGDASAAGRRLSVHLLADAAVVPLAVLDTTPHRAGRRTVATSPPGGVADATELVELAVQAGTEAGLRGAGQVEVLLRPDGTGAVHALRPWLPVEHPVSELVTGLDLVEQQLRLAAGGGLPDEPVAERPAHVLLLRVYAEDVTAESPLVRFREPSGVRVDSGCVEGDVVLPWYDPLLATLTLAGPTREDVLSRARSAVADFAVEGPRTNLPRLADLLDDPSFLAA